MKFFSSVIPSVYTDENIQSVVTDWITDERFRIKKKTVRWRGGFCGWFFPMESLRDLKRQLHTVTWPVYRLKCRRNYWGIQNGRSVRWRVLFAVRIADGFTDRRRPSVKPSEKVNICPLCRPSSPLFLLLPHPNSPQLQTTTPPKKISLFSAQQVIFLKVLWSQHPCSDLPTDFINFCK